MDTLVKLLLLILLFVGLTWAIVSAAPFLALIIIGVLMYLWASMETDEEDQ